MATGRKIEATSDDGAAAGWVEELVVERNYDGWRLDRYLVEKLKRASRSQVARFLERSITLGDGRPPKPGRIVRAGDRVLIRRTENADPGGPPLDAVRVLARLPFALVLDKPAGMLVHRTASEATRTIEAWLDVRHPELRAEPVHRLDRDTSGVLVVGIGLDAIRTLRAAFADGEVEKTYAAIVEDPEARWHPGETTTIDAPLGLDPESTLGVRMGPGTLPCRTHATCRGRTPGRADLDVRIEQGRQHQIRAHLAMFGTPIVGDKLYGMGDTFFRSWADAPGDPALEARLATRWHCLHARRVRFRFDTEDVDVTAPLPPHMATMAGPGEDGGRER